MKIWAKVTFKDGDQIQRLTLKVEGKGEEAELELALGDGEPKLLGTPLEGQTETQPVVEVPNELEADVEPIQETPAEPEEEIQPAAVVSAEPEVKPEEVPTEPEAAPEADPLEHEAESEEPATSTAEHEVQEEDLDAGDNAIHEDEVQAEPAPTQPAVVEQPVSTPEAVADAVDDEADDGEEEDSQAIPEVAKIAQESTSFDDFVEKAMLWVKIEKGHTDYFKAVINAATQVGKISWKHIEAILKRDGIKLNAYSKLRISKSVAAKFQNSKKRVTILKFIKDVVSYKNAFPNAHQAAPVKNAKEATQATSTKSQQAPTARAKMHCMPEIKEFEEGLGRIDKTQPVEERVKAVFAAMGMEKTSSEDSQLLLGIANVAVNLKDINFDAIFNNLDIPEQLRTSARMRFSSFLNNFIEKYAPDAHMVKALDFLKDLQKIVMSEQEISALV